MQLRKSTRRGAGQRLSLGIFTAAALALVAVGPNASAPSAAHRSTPVVGTAAELLIRKVDPGQPVPLELITDRWGDLTKKGYRGQGIDVALIDSGVTPVHGLDQPGKVIYGPDLSNEGGLPNLANLDTFGHGTHLAGIIAGDDGDMVGGIATASRIVSVKVAGATGATDVAQIIAGIDWVIEHKNDNALNIRVLNLSLGVPGITTSIGDPLSAAVERAWRAGIVVIVAAGNRGNGSGGLDSPAISPYVVAVGATVAYETNGDRDVVASWSSGGTDLRAPDVVAPGRSIMSFRVPGSMLDQTFPAAQVGASYFVGSGTSQAAAVVSGFAAALLSKKPNLTPDQLKYVLVRAAKKVNGGTRWNAGSGRFDPTDTSNRFKEAGKAPAQNFPAALVWPAGPTWTGGSWNGASWSGGTWSGASWSGASWSGASWSGGVWSGASWSSASWSGASWSGASWSGASWSGASWSGASWSGASWSGIGG
jgi:serine protease AprX